MLPPERDDAYFARHEAAVAEAVVRRQLGALLEKHRDAHIIVLFRELELDRPPRADAFVVTHIEDSGDGRCTDACALGGTASMRVLESLLAEYALLLRMPCIRADSQQVEFDYTDTYLCSRTSALLQLFEERAATNGPFVRPSDWTDLVPEMEYLCRRWREVGDGRKYPLGHADTVGHNRGALSTLLMCVGARCCEERFYLDRVAPHECARLQAADPALIS